LRSRLSVLLLVIAACSGERDVTVGSDKDTSGNYWGRNVSREFGEPQLGTLYQAMNSPGTDAEISSAQLRKEDSAP